MNKSGMLQHKAGGFYALIVYVVCGIIALASYFPMTNTLRVVSPLVVAALVLGLVCALFNIVKDIPYLDFLPVLFSSIALGGFVNSEGLFVSNVLMAIDGSTLETSFLLTAAFQVVALVAAILAFVMKRETTD